jgi:hypothetical protein
MDVVPPRQIDVVNLYDIGHAYRTWRIRRHSTHAPQQDRDLQGGFQMTESERIGVKAVSTVIAAVIVLNRLPSPSVSNLYAGLLQLGNESSNLVKREAERAMESFFQIYWLNNTHVVLFNNHSSVPVTLLYWVSINASTGAYTVTPLNPAIYTVPPGTMRIVQNFNKRASLYSLYSIHRVVSERGSTFEVTDAPTDLHTLIYFTPTEKIVRPGFSGRLTTFVVSTGPDFGGGDVTITCINIINTGTLVTLPCSDWGINFVTSFGNRKHCKRASARPLGAIGGGRTNPTYLQPVRLLRG